MKRAGCLGINDLARVLGQSLARKVFGLFTTYFDGSFTRKTTGVTVIAGYVGDEEQWRWVENEWNAALKYWGLPIFHLSELPEIMGHEKGSLCALNFGNILKEAGLKGVSSSVEDAYFKARNTDWARFPTPYHMCADMLFETLRDTMEGELAGETTLIVMDEDVPPGGVEVIFEAYKSFPSFAGLMFSNSRKTPLLQCADFAAGALRQNWHEGGEFNAAPPLVPMLRQGLGGVHRARILSFKAEASPVRETYLSAPDRVPVVPVREKKKP
jgi:hypothetical protein